MSKKDERWKSWGDRAALVRERDPSIQTSCPSCRAPAGQLCPRPRVHASRKERWRREEGRPQ